jgi:hypothetical protein
MSAALAWNNMIAWALQIGLLVGLGALTPVALRMRTPRARLLFRQVLLAAGMMVRRNCLPGDVWMA